MLISRVVSFVLVQVLFYVFHKLKPVSQYDARLSFRFVSVYRHFFSFRRVVHNLAFFVHVFEL